MQNQDFPTDTAVRSPGGGGRMGFILAYGHDGAFLDQSCNCCVAQVIFIPLGAAYKSVPKYCIELSKSFTVTPF